MLYNMQGQFVISMDKVCETTTIDMTGLADGIYLVRINDKITRKVIKKISNFVARFKI